MEVRFVVYVVLLQFGSVLRHPAGSDLIQRVRGLGGYLLIKNDERVTSYWKILCIRCTETISKQFIWLL